MEVGRAILHTVYLSKSVTQPSHLLHKILPLGLLVVLQSGFVELHEEAEKVGGVAARVQELFTLGRHKTFL